MVITIKDETFAGKILQEIMLEFESEEITVKDIIVGRVLKEVEQYNNRKPEYFNGLVQPSDSEVTLNGYWLKKRKQIDAEAQAYIALDAFQKNAFFILIDTIQSESLDQVVRLNKSTTVSFIKLTPLVGG